MDSIAAAVVCRTARVQRSSAEDVQSGEIWVGPGSFFFSPFPRDGDSQLPVTMFRSWLLHGPSSPFWIDNCDVELAKWATMVTELPLLLGKILATDEPVDSPSHAAALAEIIASVSCSEQVMATAIAWSWVPAEPAAVDDLQ